VVNRRESTLRRSDSSLPGRMRDCEGFGGDDAIHDPDYWLVRSKRKGTLVFLPVQKVPDWTYPFLYEFVRRKTPMVELPPAGWTQLYVNRVYSGLYLRVALPYDKRKKDGRTGPLRDVLTVNGSTLTHVDTRFHGNTDLYTKSVASGSFPKLTPPPDAIAWLALRSPCLDTILLMDNEAPYDVHLLPLPFSVQETYAARNGRSPISMVDERFLQWNKSSLSVQESRFNPLQSPEAEEFRAEFRQYGEAFIAALRTHAEYYQLHPQLSRELPAKQNSIEALGLDPMIF
ncbi:hypothetical protein, partial [Petrachloros mirabilis]